MPGFLLHLGATVECAHRGQATPMESNPRVQVDGQPITTLTTGYTVAGCTNSSPCVTAQFVEAAGQVFANGVPVLLRNSLALCAPNSTPLTVRDTQDRVRGS